MIHRLGNHCHAIRLANANSPYSVAMALAIQLAASVLMSVALRPSVLIGGPIFTFIVPGYLKNHNAANSNPN